MSFFLISVFGSIGKLQVINQLFMFLIDRLLIFLQNLQGESLSSFARLSEISVLSLRKILMLFFLISVFGSIGKLQVIDQLLIFLKARYNNFRKFVLLMGS